MNTAPLITKEIKNDLPVLIVDKTGLIGEALAESLKEESLVIFVSKEKPKDENIVHVPFFKEVPTIPDNTYSHIFFIDEEGRISKKLIEPFIKKINHDNSILILVFRKDTVDNKFISELSSQNHRIKILITGEIFAEDFIFDKRLLINKFIKEIKDNKKINIPGDGTSIIHPVFFEDVVYGILQASYIEKSFGIFLLYPKEGFTLLSILRMFQKTQPDIRADFTKNENIANYNLIYEGINLIGDYDLESKIKKINFQKELPEVERHIVKPNGFNFTKPKRLFNFFAACLIALSVIFILPLIFTIIFLVSGNVLLNSANNDMSSGAINFTKNTFNVAYYNFLFAEVNKNVLVKESKVLGMEDDFKNIERQIEKGKNASGNMISFLKSLDKLNALFFSENKIAKEDFENTVNNIKDSLIFFQSDSTNPISKNFKNLLQFSSATISSWTDALGFNGKKNYLVLFENSNTLRANGGLVVNYAILTIDDGKLEQFNLYETNKTDLNLKGHIEPPFPIRRYIGSKNFYLKDSAFDLEFSSAAVASATLILSETQQKVDGVVAVNTIFLKNLLGVIGEVKQDNLTITSENIDKLVSNNPSILSKIINSISSKITTNKDISYLNIYKLIINSIYDKDILFAFNNTTTQAQFNVAGMGGTLFDARDAMVNDALGFSESNMSNDFSNINISRSASSNVVIGSDGKITETLKLSYRNSASQSLAEKGIYKNYIRLVFPLNSSIKKIEIDGLEQKVSPAVTDPNIYESKNFTPKAGLEVESGTENGKDIYGFLVNIPPGSLKTITVSYELNSALNMLRNDFDYSLRLFKQPGIEEFPYSLSIILPGNLAFVKTSEGIVTKGNQAIFNTIVAKDTTLDFSFAKK